MTNATQWPGIKEPMTVEDASRYLAMPIQELHNWNSRGAGPIRERDGNKPGNDAVRYERSDVEKVGAAMRVVASYGLRVKNGTPARLSDWHEDDAETLRAAEVKRLLGVTQTDLNRWLINSVGPLPKRPTLKSPWGYRKNQVMELREALLTLGDYALGLASSPRPLERDG